MGLGTNNPTDTLHVYHATDNYVARFESGDAGGGIALKDNTHTSTILSSNGAFSIDVDNGGDVSGETIAFKMSGSEKLRINSSGFIGAGTANPRRHFHLHNSASATVGFQMTNGNTGESNDSQGFQLKVGSDSHAEISQMENSDLRIFTNASERLRIGSSGQIGIAGANYGAARQVIVSNGSGSAVSWSSNPFLLDMDGLGDIDYDSVFLRYRETAAITGNGLVHLGLCKSTTNCGPGRIGIPVGFIPGTAYNAHFRVDKVGITPWPDGSGHRYEFYAIISDYVSTGKLGIFYLTNSTN